MKFKKMFTGFNWHFTFPLLLIVFISVLIVPPFFTKSYVGEIDVRPKDAVTNLNNVVKISSGNSFVKQNIVTLNWKPKNNKETFLLMLASKRSNFVVDLFYLFIVGILGYIFFYNVDEDAVFASKNIVKVRIISGLIMSYPVLTMFKPDIVDFAIGLLTNNQFTVVYPIGESFGFLVWGMLTGTYAYVLNKATKLQLENDLTI